MTYTQDERATIVGPSDAAAYLSISRRTLDRLVADGKIDCHDTGAGRVFTLAQLDAWLADRHDTTGVL